MPDIFVEPETHAHHTQPQPVNPEADAIQSVDKLLHDTLHSVGIFSAFCIRPKGLKFVNQESDEIILLFLRRHFVTNVPWILATLLLSLIPLLFLAISLIPNFTFMAIPPNLIIVLTGFYYLIVLSYAFDKFVSWFYNIGIVTQKRIIDIDSTNILSHNTAAANFNEIVDVKFTQRGFLQSFFNYGDIHLQTEAIHANFEFDAAPQPTKVSDIISDLRVAKKGEHHGDA